MQLFRFLLLLPLCPLMLFAQQSLDDVAKAGIERGSVYRNPALGLTLRLPAGFVAVPLREQQAILQAGHEAAYGGDRDAAEDEHEVIDNCSRKLYWGRRGGKDAESPTVILTAVARKCFPPEPSAGSAADVKTGVKELAEEITAGLLQPPESGQGKLRVEALETREFASGAVEVYAKDVRMHVSDPLGKEHETYVAVEIAARPDYVVMLMVQAPKRAEFEVLKKSVVMSFGKSD